MKRILSIAWYLLCSLLSVVIIIPVVITISLLMQLMIVILSAIIWLLANVERVSDVHPYLKRELSLITWWRLLTGYYKKQSNKWKQLLINKVGQDGKEAIGKRHRPIDYFEQFLLGIVLKNISYNRKTK